MAWQISGGAYLHKGVNKGRGCGDNMGVADVYEVPLSSSITALPVGAFATTLDNGMLVGFSPPTRRASTTMFHLIGS